MTGVSLALIVLLGQVPATEPAALVARLGAGRYAEREEAAGALERLGSGALPALRAAHTSKDPEIRSRALALVQKIEGVLLTQPSMVVLDFHDQSVVDVAKAVGEQTGMRLTLVPENLPIWKTLRLTIRDTQPVTFWKAIDQLCDAGQLYYNLGMYGMTNNRETGFPLFYGGSRPAVPTSDQGPFRVSLVSLHYQRDVSFLPGSRVMAVPPGFGKPGGAGPVHPLRATTTTSDQFYAHLQVAAEPRLSVGQNGPLKILAATDDQGQSLILAQATGAQVLQRSAGYAGLTANSIIPLQVPLQRPEKPGATIKKLRGTVALAVATRKPNPLVVALAGAAGKSFHNDDVALNVQEIKVNPDTHQTSIELSVRTTAANHATAPAANGPGAEFAFPRPETHQQQLEVLDAQGRTIPWYHSNYDGEGSRMVLTLTPPDPAMVPTQLRYFSLARATTEVGFEFNNVPMP